MRKITSILGMVFLFISLGSISVSATNTEMGGYTIEGVPNKQQLDPNVGYFYLHEDIGAEDSVKVKLTNSSEQDKTLNIKITNANTNVNGSIDYSGKLKNHSSLKVPLTSIAIATQKDVLVPKKSSIETEVKIKMPDYKLSGVIIGGIVVSEKPIENKLKEKISLSNMYSYTLGLVLTNELEVELNKNISVKLENISATLFDGRKVIQANILNPNPYIFSKATATGEIFEKGVNKPLQKIKKNNINIAPYSIYPLQFDWKKEDIKAGKYVFKGVIKANGKIWRLEKEFEISSTKARKINKESAYKIIIPFWLIYSIYALIVLSVGGTVYLVIRKKKGRLIM